MEIKRKISHLKEQIVNACRMKYNMAKIKRLKNTNPTIISRNCVGGIIYHDLGLKFMSPTINLSMSNEDFIEFLENLESFTGQDAQLIECHDGHYKYPVGELIVDDISIKIEFVHYRSFEEAKYKWHERVKRINYSNIYIIWEYSNTYGPEYELWERFKSLKKNNKVLITGTKFQIIDNNIVGLKLYEKNYYYGKILEFQQGIKFYKRFLDDFDYVNFLNQ